MSKEITIALVSSVASAALVFIASGAMGLYDKEIKDSQIHEVAFEVVNEAKYRNTIIDKMNESGDFVGATGVPGNVGNKGDKGDKGVPGSDGDWRAGEIKPLTSVARAICYSALSGTNDHALIMIPLENNTIDLDAKCHSTINNGWHAGGVAKGNYFNQDCPDIENISYGGGYTSFVTEKSFESKRANYKSCNSKNAFICCSPQFTN